uniref:Uncharacterized protein n=1 Tax=Arundo donax TaxID=35708 RepID=A0A0A8YAB4_ARUDO
MQNNVNISSKPIKLHNQATIVLSYSII